MKAIKNKKKIIALFGVCMAVISLTACGAETENIVLNMSHTDYSSESIITTKELQSETKEDFSANPDIVSSKESSETELSGIYSYSYDVATPIVEETTIRKNTQTEESLEIPIDSDYTMHDNNDIVTYDPISPDISGDSDGNVLLIAALMSQMGNTPLRVSKDESAFLIRMLNEIEMEPIDYPDPMNIPLGGGYIMEIEGEEKYELLGGGYIKIGDSYYYDNNGKSDELSAKIGNVLYGYYGEP